ncbi:MAG TPA: hypothetical protein DER68_00395 [Ruminococcaceae bacterium]|nr:hypothetical protein [Oscillospiraceae bacterium]
MKNKIISAAIAAILLAGCSAGGASSGESSEISVSDSAARSDNSSGEYVPGERDQNGVYVAEGYAARLEYPLDEKSVGYAAKRFQYVYDEYLNGKSGNVFVTVVPDKNLFLAEKNGYPAMDYAKLVKLLTENMDFAEYIDVFPMLELSDYYRTDTHWKQEKITDIACFIAERMGVGLSAEYTLEKLDKPFYGVHCRQADIDVEPDELVYLKSAFMTDCTVLDGETNKLTDIYNLQLAEGDDPYEIFLSGAKSLMTIENPNAASGRELVIFRDSFASSIAPLLAESYSKITLIDIRYLAPELLGRFVDFGGSDVLFMYSAPVLNNSVTIK